MSKNKIINFLTRCDFRRTIEWHGWCIWFFPWRKLAQFMHQRLGFCREMQENTSRMDIPYTAFQCTQLIKIFLLSKNIFTSDSKLNDATVSYGINMIYSKSSRDVRDKNVRSHQHYFGYFWLFSEHSTYIYIPM